MTRGEGSKSRKKATKKATKKEKKRAEADEKKRGEEAGDGGDGPGGDDPDPGPKCDNCVLAVYAELDSRFYTEQDPPELGAAFISKVRREAFSKWAAHLPGVVEGDLTILPVPPIPPPPMHSEWTGWLLVGVAKKELRLFNQFAGLQCDKHELTMELDGLRESFQKQVLDERHSISQRHFLQMEDLSSKVAYLMSKMEDQQRTNEDQQRTNEGLKRENAEMRNSLQNVQELLHDEMRIGNHARRRHPLGLARERAIKLLGKESRGEDQSWKAYFDTFSVQDWDTLLEGAELGAGDQEKVQKIFKNGSRESNKIIHGFKAAECEKSILDAKLGNDQDAWIYIWKFGFALPMDTTDLAL